jgi:hypothetical protein
MGKRRESDAFFDFICVEEYSESFIVCGGCNVGRSLFLVTSREKAGRRFVLNVIPIFLLRYL